MPRVQAKFRLLPIFFEDGEHYIPASLKKRGTKYIHEGHYYTEPDIHYAYIKKQPDSYRANRYISHWKKYMVEVGKKPIIFISEEANTEEIGS